ncbi:MAG: tRNA (adenosine(37)-N6)-threonylcarbamoyltransferase complex dimerization subunit type 1 TsaB [Planctomycetota bacterium]|jgi:tRNA threonylcarbamoyladenosine biosynthesis protein TsaB
MAETNLILAVETSSRVGSVAIARGETLLAETAFSAPLKHSAELFPAIGDLLDSCGYQPGQIEHIYISSGPGSFTGLRISAAFAKTMHLANATRIVSVDTLDVVAANVIDLGQENVRLAEDAEPADTGHDRIAVIVDAKRGQFFIAAYERGESGKWTKTLPDCLMTASGFLAQFAGKDKPVCLLGDGLLYYKGKFQADGVSFFDEELWSPRAAKVYLLGREKGLRGEFDDPLTLTPNYLRRPDVTIKPV